MWRTRKTPYQCGKGFSAIVISDHLAHVAWVRGSLSGRHVRLNGSQRPNPLNRMPRTVSSAGHSLFHWQGRAIYVYRRYMTYEQLITPNPNIWCRPGWCLEYVRSAFGLPIVEPSATKGWENADYKHHDKDFPDAWVPLWFSIDEIPEGHVALRSPDGRIYSTSTNANSPYVHPNLDHLIWFYGPRVEPEYQLHLRYLGWTEDISNVRVVENMTMSVESVDDMGLTPEQAQQLAYIASPEFKRDIFTGAEPMEREARTQFVQEIFNTDMPWYGFNGEVPNGDRKTTNLKTDLGWNDTRFAGLSAQVAALREIVTQLSVAQGVTIDYARIAEAVTDELGKRITA